MVKVVAVSKVRVLEKERDIIVKGMAGEKVVGEWKRGRDGDRSWLGLESLMSEIYERREECDKLTRELEMRRQHFKEAVRWMGLRSRCLT